MTSVSTVWVDLMGSSVNYYDAGGIRTRCIEAGSGPAVIFLHGIGVTHVVIHRNWLDAGAEARIDASQGLVHVESQGPISIFRLRSAGTMSVR